jgi:hypothetical protein
VLRKLDYGEADRIFTFLTREHGKVGAIAKGVRRQESKLGPSLELYGHVDLLLAKGRGELDVVAQVQRLPGLRIPGDVEVMSHAALIAELARSDVPPRARASLLRSWDSVLGLDLDRAQPAISLPDGASALLESRERARAAKDFVTSDRLRNELAALGVAVTDTPDGQRWRVSGRTATHI